MVEFHIFRKDKNKDCSVNYVKDRKDVVIYSKDDFSSFNFENKILLQLGAEPLTSKDFGKDLIIVDMGWKDALRLSKRFPLGLQKRSISGFKTAYPKTKKASIRPESGLRTIECMFVAKLIMTGIKDENIMENYHFRREFLDVNKGGIEKYMKK